MENPPPSDPQDGLRGLLDHWKIHYRLNAESGHVHVVETTGHAKGTSRAVGISEQVIRSVGIPFEEQVGNPSLGLDQELVIQAAVIPRDLKPETLGILITGVAVPWREILRNLERDENFLTNIHPRALEEMIARAYRDSGYSNVILTPYSGDKGRDVIVSATLPGIGTIKIVDQVKRYAPHRRVPADDVRALLGVLTRDQDGSKGIVTTTSDFAPGVYEEFKPFMDSRLELKNGHQLKEWLTKLADKE